MRTLSQVSPAGKVGQSMTIKPQSDNPANAARGTTNLGFIRPPYVYLISSVAGVLAQVGIPLRFLPRTLATPLGATLIVVAIGLLSWSVREFRSAGTPVPARQPTTVIVRTGPYGFSRNPIYLAFTLLQLGIAIWVNSLWLLATLAGAVAVIHLNVIPREERYLEKRFASQYLDYKSSVRRWL